PQPPPPRRGRALLRATEARGAPRGALLHGRANPQVPRPLRDGARPQSERAQAPGRCEGVVRGPLDVPDDGVAGLRVPACDEAAHPEISAARRPARSRRRAAAARGLPGLAAAAPLRRGRPLPALSRAGSLGYFAAAFLKSPA